MSQFDPPLTEAAATDAAALSAAASSVEGSLNSAKAPPAPRRRSRWLRGLAWLPGGMILVLLLALAGVWVWAGAEGSLATALRWAGAVQPLTAEGVTGNLRNAGKVRRLVWQQGGLRVQVQDAEWRWTPAALLGRTLQIDRLSASRIEIDDQSPQSAAPSVGPPASVALPVKLQIKDIAIGELRWAGPPAIAVQDIAARFDYDGARHLLTLDRARAEGGLFQARAAVSAHAPVSIDLALAGALKAPVPGSAQPVPLTAQAVLQGPLSDMRAQADLYANLSANTAAATAEPQLPALPEPGASAPASTSASNTPPAPEAHASARITPWAAQPLPEAHARVRALDVGALWAEAPRTDLTGQFDLTPLPAGGPAGWAIQADIANAAPGPWDQRRLPLSGVLADVSWAGGVATVRTLSARVGGGTIQSRGRWAAPASGQLDAAQGAWQIDTRIDGVNPAALHTQLAALPIDGTAKVAGAGAAIDFDAALQTRPSAKPLAHDLHLLHLRDLLAAGRWEQGLLTFDRLRLRTDEAELAGQASVRPSVPGGSADLSFTAPGVTLTLKGQSQPDSGAGALHADISDAARLLAWARMLPGGRDALAGMQASGHATLNADWRGGWRDPTLHARLDAPRFDWQARDGVAPIQARQLDLTLAGKLAQAQLDFSGQLAQGPRQLDLRLTVSGGRTTPRASLAQSSWRVALGPLQAGVRDQVLGEGAWQLATRGAVPLTWSPQGGGQFEAGAGELTLTSPAPVSQAVIAWRPARWHAGELSTTGRITGLPLQWAERLHALADTGLTGDALFNADWDVAQGRELRVTANLARASGDLALVATDAQTGLQNRVAAGLREARLTLSSAGQALNLQLKWDSAHAGSVDGTLRTELSATRDAEGRTQWAWPEDAPLQGRLQARLPQLSVWSVLAPPGWRLRGALRADASIGGTRAAPLAQGTLAADDLALRSVVDGVQFGAGRLRARLDGTRLVIDEFLLHGTAGKDDSGGTLRASGEAGWIGGHAQARLTATLDKLRASIRADRQLTVSGQVQAALEDRLVKADGSLHVDHARIALPDESAPSLGDDVIVRGAGGKVMYGQPAAAKTQPSAADAVAETAAGGGSPLGVAAKVRIDLGDDFRLQGMGIGTRLAGTLTLASNGPIAAMPQLTGSVRTVDGSVRAYSQQLDIRRGNIVFTGQASNPALDIIALRPNYTSDQRVGVQVMGTALLPHVRLYSEPALPDNETLAWLLLGRAAPSSGAEAAMLQSAALAMLGGREGRGLASHFGLDELNFGGGTDGTLASASVTMGKRLSDRLYAAYEYSLSGASGTLLIFYELSRRWTLRSQTNENAAVDLIYRLSFD